MKSTQPKLSPRVESQIFSLMLLGPFTLPIIQHSYVSTDTAIFGNNVLFDIPFAANWNKIGRQRQHHLDCNTIYENNYKVEWDHMIGDKMLMIKDCILCKSDLYDSNPWPITAVHTNWTIRVQHRTKSQRLNIDMNQVSDMRQGCSQGSFYEIPIIKTQYLSSSLCVIQKKQKILVSEKIAFKHTDLSSMSLRNKIPKRRLLSQLLAVKRKGRHLRERIMSCSCPSLQPISVSWLSLQPISIMIIM